jgi:quinone-modifying oxidoreductase, subunit QmoC
VARLVGAARTTWPLLLGLPVLFWAVLIQAVNGFAVPPGPLAYAAVVPQWMIYAIFLPAALFAAAVSAVSARRCWTAWGEGARREGSLLRSLGAVALEILGHRRFQRCGTARPRRLGHLLLLWGFLGALLTTTLLGVAMDIFGVRTPLPQLHPIKLLGNLSAVLLVAGGAWLVVNRIAHPAAAGTLHAFDVFFGMLVLLVILSGVGSELARVALPARAALAVYVLHLGTVLALFLTFPFSKFAHALYRTLAMMHERMTAERSPP